MGAREDMMITLREARVNQEERMLSADVASLAVNDQEKSIYATPRVVTDVNECYFYHTMEIPGYGCVEGEWDLRQSAREYLGGVEFRGKRVLEVGTASGFLCFYMESQGADVVAYDLSEEQSLDVVPFSRYDHKQYELTSKQTLVRDLNNAYWLGHRAYNSNAKVVYGTTYAIPEEIGMVDISTFGSVLLHLRDPFLALQNALRLTRETAIITDVMPSQFLLQHVLGKFGRPSMAFLPQFAKCEPKVAWWFLPPEIIKRFIGVLGFEDVRVKYHVSSKYNGIRRLLYTVVGHRTR
jgi:hypothetical protein